MKKKINTNTVKWGIIGVGDVCEVKSAPAMQLIQQSELVAVMRRDGDKSRDFAKRHGVPQWYDNADELIHNPNINAIYIATPPDSHEAYTIKAAQAGKPVYVEKPMARTVQECQNMITACEEANVPLYVAYYRRALPNFLKLKKLIEAKVIGDIRLVKIELYKTIKPDLIAKTIDNMPLNWRVQPAISGGGYFFDLAAHQLDYLDFVFGPIEEAKGFATNQTDYYKAADLVTGNFKFKNGIMGIGTWCFSVNEVAQKDELTIIGSKGIIKVPFFGKPEFSIEKSGESIKTYMFKLPKHIQQPLIQDIVDDLLGKKICKSTGETALRSNWVMEQLTKEFYSVEV
jgi:predicted dehydrogenase